MTPECWEQVGRLYEAALEVPAEERAAFLDRSCGSDPALRRELESLLAAAGEAGSFLAAGAMQDAAQLLRAEKSVQLVGRRLNQYEVKSLLGSGGMGEVYLANDTRLGRKVAIKVLPAEFMSDQGRVRRFAQEAHAASSLNHPNIITIYEIGEAAEEDGGIHYIVTEYVEGETLRQRIASASGNGMKLVDALEIAAQVAAALAAAHGAGITHRDIKPENVMVRPDGLIKVLDFGLAKLTETPALPIDSQFSTLVRLSTEAGMVMGTTGYMSPEQARGERVDARTDIFSLGAMLYEMVAGQAPFTGATTSEIIAAILRDEPPLLSHEATETPPELERIVSGALCKNREKRYQTIILMLADLKQLKRLLEHQDDLVRAGPSALTDHTLKQSESTAEVKPGHLTAGYLVGGNWRRKLLAACALALVVGSTAGWLYWRHAKLNQAQAALPRIEELVSAERFFEAYDLALEAQRYLPNDPTLARLMGTVADDLSIETDPPGAKVYLKRFSSDESGKFPARQFIGTSPINHQQIARGAYVVSMEKEGYAALERTVHGTVLQLGGMLLPSQPIHLEAKLAEAEQVPARMTFVPGGVYRLVAWLRPSAERLQLGDYFIDRYEVTNREYKEFISAGGYRKREFWRHKFVKDGHEISWEEAISGFKDRTGLPGPRSWQNQEIPEGKAEHPVTDITWYEAAAYAAFRGKELPTVFQWEKAARDGQTMDAGVIMPWGLYTGTGTLEQRANFGRRGTLPVESLEFGQSPYGCYHMAGNVAEWCRNQSDGGFATAGGSWDDPPYLFGYYGAFPGLYSSGKLGFRCALNSPSATGDQGAQALHPDAEVPVYKPAGEASFRAWQAQYYHYAQPPLDAAVEERIETDDWRREKITYVGARGERAIAYLYLPKQSAPPWQVIQIIPPGDSFWGITPIEVGLEARSPALLKLGRAVLAVVLKGFPERAWPPNHKMPAQGTEEYRDMVLDWITDERRALDYVATRSDLDSSRIAYYSTSYDASFKLGLPSVEPRYRAVVLNGNCLREEDQVLPEINPVNLVPNMRAPKLMLQGRYDEGCRLKSQAEPLFKLLREPKRIVLYESGHILPLGLSVPTINHWLDETMGPVSLR